MRRQDRGIVPVPRALARLIIALLFLLPPAACVREHPPLEPERVLHILVSLLDDPQPEIRRTAAESLGKIGLAAAGGPLVRALDDPDPRVRASSAGALGSLGERVADRAAHPLGERLRDPSDEVKYAAARAVAAVGGTPGVVEVLVGSLRDPEAETRLAAALALGGLDASAAFSALAAATRDDDGRVRQAAVSALGELADRRAVPWFKERLLSDPVPGVRSEAAYRLGKLGAMTDRAVLRLAASRDRSASVRWWAAWASEELSSIGGSG